MQSSTTDTQSLFARVEILEKQNKLFKRAGLALLLLPVAFVVMGQAKPDRNLDVDTIHASKIDANVIELRNEESGTLTLITPGFATMQQTKDKNIVTISVLSEGPSLSLIDKQGFEAALGVWGTLTPRTGETHQTSAASLILFDRDKKVLWSAPH